MNVLADDVEVFDHVAYLFEGKGPFLEYLQIVTVGAEATTFALHQSSCRAISDTSLDDPRMTQVRAAVEVILKSNEPRSALAHDRHWNLVMANAAFVRFLTMALGKEPAGLVPLTVSTPPRLNILRMLFDPNGVRKVILNWEEIAKSLLNEAYRRLAWARDDTLRNLITEILAYPGVPARWREPDLEAPHALILPMEMTVDGKIARMFSTVTTVATPHDVTLQELHVEVFYPADAETESVLQAYEQRAKLK